MKEDNQRHFLVTNKAKGLSLYNSFTGPTNISKFEFIARKRDREVYGDNYGSKLVFGNSGFVRNQQPKSTVLKSGGFQFMAESRIAPEENFQPTNSEATVFGGGRRFANRSKAVTFDRNENFRQKESSFKKISTKSSGQRQNNMASRTNDSFFDPDESFISGPANNLSKSELRRSTRENKVNIIKFWYFITLVIIISNQGQKKSVEPSEKFSPKKSKITQGRRNQNSKFFSRTTPATPEQNLAALGPAQNQYSGPIATYQAFGNQPNFLPNFVGGNCRDFSLNSFG